MIKMIRTVCIIKIAACKFNQKEEYYVWKYIHIVLVIIYTLAEIRVVLRRSRSVAIVAIQIYYRS